MRFDNQLLTLWYGTDDTPSPPEGEVQGRRGVSLTVAVQPPNPCNVVTVRYRVDQGPVQSVRGVRLRTDYVRRVEYHRVEFPDFRVGEQVVYLPTMACAGRIAPNRQAGMTFPSSFLLAGALPPCGAGSFDRVGKQPPPDAGRLPFSLEYLATIHIPLKEPETIGVTPDGIKVNWYWSPAEGMVAGPKLNAKVRHLGGDWMTIRRDGVGMIDVRATLETDDSALLSIEYRGYYELGPNGYQDFLERRWPVRAPTRTTPRFQTAHPRYLWLNRLQCVGIGEVRIDRNVTYTYDLYALK